MRVDGAADEGPSHEAVQFWWTLWHFTQKKVATLVTTRSSGSSYLNRVELQNGCLALGHSNTFIPSTETVNQAKLKENLDMAMSAYISHVNGCPCGDSNIMLFRGCDSEVNQVKSEKLSIFLKGSKRAKEKLKSDYLDEFDHLQMIWDICNRDLVHGLPSSCVFFIKCCSQPDCKHPVCKLGQPQETITCFPNGPPISHLPFPVFDEARPGHYTTLMLDTGNEDDKKIIKPPSIVIKERFSVLGGLITESSLHSVSNEVILTVEEVSMWFDHLTVICKNRQRGAKKAAETRHLRRQQAGQSTYMQVTGNVRESKDSEDQRQQVDVDHEQVTDQEPRKEHKQQTEEGICGSCGKDYNCD